MAKPARRTTRTEEAMHDRLATLPPGTLRHDTLRTALDFKRSWLELARYLAEVNQNGEYREWGYTSFEAYAQHELHLKRDTALKLLRSYTFLASHERPILDVHEGGGGGGGPVPLPSFQALDILAQARENPNLPERDYHELREQVFQQDPTPAQLRRFVRERAPQAATEPVRPDPAERMRKYLAQAERLYGSLVEDEEVPEHVTRGLEEVVGALRQIVGD